MAESNLKTYGIVAESGYDYTMRSLSYLAVAFVSIRFIVIFTHRTGDGEGCTAAHNVPQGHTVVRDEEGRRQLRHISLGCPSLMLNSTLDPGHAFDLATPC